MNYPVVGQKVVCIAKGTWERLRRDYPGTNCPQKGYIYTIRDVYRDPFSGETGIRLVEIINEDFFMLGGVKYYAEIGWCPHEFSPLEEKKTDISIFEKILTGIKVHENSQ